MIPCIVKSTVNVWSVEDKLILKTFTSRFKFVPKFFNLAEVKNIMFYVDKGSTRKSSSIVFAFLESFDLQVT